MRSRDHLLRLIRERVHHPANARELMRLLEVGREERATFKRQLTSLVNDGSLVMVSGNRYGLADRMDLVVGRLQAHPAGYGFVTP
jgi:ribonuclease R